MKKIEDYSGKYEIAKLHKSSCVFSTNIYFSFIEVYLGFVHFKVLRCRIYNLSDEFKMIIYTFNF